MCILNLNYGSKYMDDPESRACRETRAGSVWFTAYEAGILCSEAALDGDIVMGPRQPNQRLMESFPIL